MKPKGQPRKAKARAKHLISKDRMLKVSITEPKQKDVKYVHSCGNPGECARTYRGSTFTCGHCKRVCGACMGAHDQLEDAIGPICDDCWSIADKILKFVAKVGWRGELSIIGHIPEVGPNKSKVEDMLYALVTAGLLKWFGDNTKPLRYEITEAGRDLLHGRQMKAPAKEDHPDIDDRALRRVIGASSQYGGERKEEKAQATYITMPFTIFGTFGECTLVEWVRGQCMTIRFQEGTNKVEALKAMERVVENLIRSNIGIGDYVRREG